MAIICHKHKLLFIMVPGTGCSSLGKVLKQELGGKMIPHDPILENHKRVVSSKHSTIDQLLQFNIISPQELNPYLKFATVRNPFDRYVTEYARLVGDYYISRMDHQHPDVWVNRLGEAQRERLKKKKIKEIQQARDEGFNQWILRRLKYIILSKRFDQRVKNRLKLILGKKVNYHPQLLQLYPMLQGVDEIIRYERLEEDLNYILRKVGIEKWISIPHTNKTSGKKQYSEYYDLKTREMLSNILSEELKIFGYEFYGNNAKDWEQLQRKALTKYNKLYRRMALT